MKTALLLFLMMILPMLAMGQTLVEFTWDQPDSTGGTVQPDSTLCCKIAIPDGGLDHYEVFTATATDTLYWGEVPALYTIAEPVVALIPFELYVEMSIAVRAFDIRGVGGPMSGWSDAFTVDPGPPGAPNTPVPIKVFFGG
jgi:hypothetical protein